MMLVKYGYVRKYGTRRARRYIKKSIKKRYYGKGYAITTYSKPKFNKKKGRWNMKQKAKTRYVKKLPRRLRKRL